MRSYALRNDADAAEAAWGMCEDVLEVDNIAHELERMLPPRTKDSFSNSYTFFWAMFLDECKPVVDLMNKWQEQDKERFGE